jgi:hypothetical protein
MPLVKKPPPSDHPWAGEQFIEAPTTWTAMGSIDEKTTSTCLTGRPPRGYKRGEKERQSVPSVSLEPGPLAAAAVGSIPSIPNGGDIPSQY